MSNPSSQKKFGAKLTQIHPCYCEIALDIGVLVGLNIVLVALATGFKNLAPLAFRLLLEWFKIGSRSPQFGPG